MKYLSIIKYLFLAISVIVVAVFFAGFADVDAMLFWAYILLGLTVAVVVIAPIVNLISNPKGAVGSLIGVAIVALVFGVAYALASDAPVVNSAGGFFENPTELKLSDMGLYATYFVLASTILVVIGGEIRNTLK
ncbi:MAG: hypothetical protein R3Y38_05530 [Rikenellaceae bacterium]